MLVDIRQEAFFPRCVYWNTSANGKTYILVFDWNRINECLWQMDTGDGVRADAV